MIWKSVSHQLKHAVEHEGKSYTHVTLKEPNVEALEAIGDLGIEDGKAPTIRQLRGLIVALADVPAPVIGRMHRDDFTALGTLVVPLLLSDTTAATSTASSETSPTS